MNTPTTGPDRLREAAYRAHAALDQLVRLGGAPRDVVAARDELAAALGVRRPTP
ncbi:hypothetical protein ACTWP5_27450 [Streptomyces sp. 4N509B]|uniref:hypothetical protein n=1 Tax=Streptomyces sp. 4N509B TaxID=3457413 RepID=UPI003FCF69EE